MLDDPADQAEIRDGSAFDPVQVESWLGSVLYRNALILILWLRQHIDKFPKRISLVYNRRRYRIRRGKLLRHLCISARLFCFEAFENYLGVAEYHSIVDERRGELTVPGLP